MVTEQRLRKYSFKLYFAGSVESSIDRESRYAWYMTQFMGRGYGNERNRKPEQVLPMEKKGQPCQLAGKADYPCGYKDDLIAQYVALKQGLIFLLNSGCEIMDRIGHLCVCTSSHKTAISLQNYNSYLKGAAAILKNVDAFVNELREECAEILMQMDLPVNFWEVEYVSQGKEIKWCKEHVKAGLVSL